MNGWLLSIGPESGYNSTLDRAMAVALGCPYASYADSGGWYCGHCNGHIRNSQLIKLDRDWYHGPCLDASGVPRAAALFERPWPGSCRSIVYNYYTRHSARADMLDDIRKMVTLGYSVTIDAHEVYGLDNLQSSGIAGTICHNRDDLETVSRYGRATLIPYPAQPVNSAIDWLSKQEHRHLVGWHGVWTPASNVDKLIKAVAHLKHDIDVGLVLSGSLNIVGGKTLISEVSYRSYCLNLAGEIGLTIANQEDIANCSLYCQLDCRQRAVVRGISPYLPYGRPIIVPDHQSDVALVVGDDLETITSRVKLTTAEIATAIRTILVRGDVAERHSEETRLVAGTRTLPSVVESYLSFID